MRIPAENLVGEENRGWGLAKVTLGNERVSLSSGGALWGMGPVGRRPARPRARPGRASPTRCCASASPQLHIEAELLRLIRLRTVTAAHQGRAARARRRRSARSSPTSTASAIMGLAKDLAGAGGMLADDRPARRRRPTCGTTASCSRPALTIGGGTGEVQRNIIAERVLGLPADVDPARTVRADGAELLRSCCASGPLLSRSRRSLNLVIGAGTPQTGPIEKVVLCAHRSLFAVAYRFAACRRPSPATALAGSSDAGPGHRRGGAGRLDADRHGARGRRGPRHAAARAGVGVDGPHGRPGRPGRARRPARRRSGPTS